MNTTSLGGFLRERRARLQPDGALTGRRRTPGLRREEVATRAKVSVTWYTWLEQGRGGAPSDDVLERLAAALELDATARELLFLLARQHLPPRRPSSQVAVPPSVQHVLDAMPNSPAFVKDVAWEIVAWNQAARVVLADYAAMEPGNRNLLRRMFTPEMRQKMVDWEVNARFAIAVLRVDMARSGDPPEARALADELGASNEEFRRFWAESDARNYGSGLKRVAHPTAGLLQLEYSAFAVSDAEALTMVVFTPAGPADAEAIDALLA